ncbi:iron dicitrate transport regulator FecR [Pedobacter sp. KBW06]|uniref:FecR family protein n=1 Tax=Pedobacter sp. KBW06 TaxID=2153359 RepID=UPI000F5A888F|nr:FecR family protein [Pedobacter sp. KBW06]RQO74471.1 iron dicitrate transport regulator FecR [Pedobacter sp. KBW06]
MENYTSNYFYASLIMKSLKDDLDQAEKAELDRWLKADIKHQQIFKKLNDRQRIVKELEIYSSFDKDQIRQRLLVQVNSTRKASRLWVRIISVAAVIGGVVIGIWFFNTSSQQADNRKDVNYANDIAPGKNMAILTVSGKNINLSGARNGIVVNAENIVYDDGTSVIEEAIKSFTMTTPRGGVYQLSLPDGTRVWLNSASSLTYDFAPNEDRLVRSVKLSGEAYFEVTKDNRHPFIVKTQTQDVEVLGTHFSINAYTDEESAKTTLFEGSVKVRSLSLGEGIPEQVIVLKPGEQSALANNAIKVSPANMEQALAWKNNYFMFENENIRSIMRKVSRWYNVDVIYQGNVEQKSIEGTVSKFKNVSTVLKILERTKVVKFKIEGKQIIVMPWKGNN